MDYTSRRRGLLFIVFAMALFVAVAFSMPETASAKVKKPGKVTSLTASVTYDSVTLHWGKVKKCKSYIVYRSLKKGAKFKQLAVVKKKRKYTDTGLDTGSTVKYKVCALKGTRKGKKSQAVAATPVLDTPILSAASDVYGNHLTIVRVAGADGYLIYRDDKLISDQKNTEAMEAASAFDVLDSEAPDKVECTYTAAAYRYVGSKAVESERSLEVVAKRPAVNVKLKNAVAPTGQLFLGSPFTISGKIKSNMTIQSVKLGAVNAKGKWKSRTSYENDEVNSLTFDIYKKADSSVKFGKLAVGNYTYTVLATLENGSEWTLMEQPFEVIEIPVEEVEVTGGAGKICKVAKQCAWPYGTAKKVYKYKGGDPTDAYKEALQAVYPDRGSWSAKPRAGASCDVFVGTCVRASGYDRSFPRGLSDVLSHINKNPQLWEKHKELKTASQMQPGDIIFQQWVSSGTKYGHIMIYLGNDRVANAHYGSGGRYGIIENASSLIRTNTSYRKIKKHFVFRPAK